MNEGRTLINAALQIEMALQDLAYLETLKTKADPASCISIAFRLGVVEDNPDAEYDSENRPWQKMPFHGYGDGTLSSLDVIRELIDMVIKDRRTSLECWIKAANRDRETLKAAVERAEKVLARFRKDSK